MKKYFLLLLLPGILSACVNRPEAETSKARVTVSILPEVYFVRQIAGDLFDIDVMVPPGANPAIYEPTPQQLHGLSQSSLFLKIGYSAFESAWMEKLQSVNPAMAITDLSRGIPLIEEDHEHDGMHSSVNPHTWLSPKNAEIIARNTAEDLTLTFPVDSALFRQNLQVLLQKIRELDSIIHSDLDSLSGRSFLIYHPALSYFARDYGLEQYSMEHDGKEPSPAHMKYLADVAKEKGISVIFLQMQFDQHNAEALARETGASIVQINPLDPEWYEQMLSISGVFKDKLK